MKNSLMFLLVIVTCLLASATGQTTAARKAAPKQPTAAPQSLPQTDLNSASSTADKFLNGLKIVDLPEGKQMLQQTQWVVAQSDLYPKFYEYVVYTEASTLFESLFSTDVPGTQGYKRLVEVKAVSEAGTPIVSRYLLVLYPDKGTHDWKVFYFGDATDAEHELEAAQSNLNNTRVSSSQHNYARLAFWEINSGHIGSAKSDLDLAARANETPSDPLMASSRPYIEFDQRYIAAMADIVKHVLGQ